jgi:hypothetical protein
VEAIFMTAPSTPPVERQVAHHIVRHGLVVAPLIVAVAAVLRGRNGAISAAIALAIVLVNFLVAAALLDRAAPAGPTALGIAAAVGYVVRLSLIVAALVALRHRSWIDLPTLGVVLVGTHVGLLFWEMKYLSLTLAAPALRPAPPSPLGEHR